MKHSVELNNLEVVGIWITKTGLMIWHPEVGYFYCDNTGKFRRYAGTEECEGLEALLPEITDGHNFPYVELPYQIPARPRKVYNTFNGWAGEYRISGDIVTLCIADNSDEPEAQQAYAVWADYAYSPEICDQAEALGFHLVG